ncbi:acyltransferase [Shewanella sp. ALD9]|uniref:acyltransferase n=1 Tax=Shewanella sp. ALD9 TaxID=2058330 RepID=UPI000C328F41|nr:acyltransferase [Shewanella sp. ALD9]PKH31894.1 capsule biosynthesis protein CapG [Shewanella sp. ALD9]
MALIKKLYDLYQKIFYSPNKLAKVKGVNLGENCKLNKKISFGSEPYLISLGNDFYCSTGIKFITHDGAVNVLRNINPDLTRADLFGKIEIGDNVFLGCNVIVLPNTTIGNNVIVGAGSIVRGCLESNFVYAGVPVRKIMSLEDYKSKVTPKIKFTKHLSAEEKKNYLMSNYL